MAKLIAITKRFASSFSSSTFPLFSTLIVALFLVSCVGGTGSPGNLAAPGGVGEEPAEVGSSPAERPAVWGDTDIDDFDKLAEKIQNAPPLYKDDSALAEEGSNYQLTSGELDSEDLENIENINEFVDEMGELRKPLMPKSNLSGEVEEDDEEEGEIEPIELHFLY